VFTFLRVASAFVAPVLVLAAAHYLAPLVTTLPPTLAGLRTWGPIIALLLAAGLALVFNRGRVLFGVASLCVAFVAYKLQVQPDLTGFAGRSVFGALSLFVPLNLAVLVLLRERGVFSFYGLRRAGTIVLQVLLTIWVVAGERTAVTDWLYYPFVAVTALQALPVPQPALLVMLAGIMLAVGVAVASRTAIDAAFAGALAAFFIGCNTVTLPNHFAIYTAAAAVMLGVGVLHDTYRLAFRDELTGLPSRRALNERMMALGNHYSMAMLDVDHFKSFNDTWGHDLGDQVVKMVARKIEAIGGGGRAYRYGGEEFVIVFPGKSLRDVWSHLEAVRRSIEAYRVAIRGPDRPAEPEPGRAQRGTGLAGHTVSVTVSIGVAQRDDRNLSPADVLLAADRALYRAKEKGRNQVSR
jgi:GGDEF domain-containing protein